MGQRRVDREWPIPKATRHVWIAPERPYEPPQQGYVLDWRSHRYRWWAHVLTVITTDAGPVTLTRWLPVSSLKPVRSDPNTGIWGPLRSQIR